MNLYQCQEKAKNVGFDKAKFLAVFPAGIVECQWLDAYMGLLTIDIPEMGNSCLMVHQVDKQFPTLECSEPYVEEKEND